MAAETERVRRIYDDLAERYDRLIGFSEKVLFEGGREWVCSRASGDVLEVAVGTGRNLPHYPKDVRLTGIELSPGMLEIARTCARALAPGNSAWTRICAWATLRRSPSPTTPSTR